MASTNRATRGAAPGSGRAAAATRSPLPEGEIRFRHGGRSYRLPLETAAFEAVPLRDRVEVHVSLVYRDARNRTFAIAFVHRGPGPVTERLVSDLTVSTPSGVSKARAGASRCALVLSIGTGDAVVGTGRCTELRGFDGDRRAPEVIDIRFSGSAARR